MLNNITARQIYLNNRNNFFFKVDTSHKTLSNKLMSTKDWNDIIDVIGVDNRNEVNEFISQIAFAENKVVYAVNPKIGVIIPAIITELEDHVGVCTISLILNKQEIHVVNHFEYNDIVLFLTKKDAYLYSAPLLN